MMAHEAQTRPLHVSQADDQQPICIFLCGDLMPGRGIDQILPHPCPPNLYERFVRNARRYVQLAERINGPIPATVDFAYIWGDALDELERLQPDLRLINLETSVTQSEEYWPDKGINYRLSPENIGALEVAQIDGCALANNHVLDWGRSGLRETLATLKRHNIQYAGVGKNLQQAQAPAIFALAHQNTRVLLFSCTLSSSGTPTEWAAAQGSSGVHLLADLSEQSAGLLGEQIGQFKKAGDLVILSIHWGGNWGYRIPEEQVQFAHRLIDQAQVDLVHGHSSHHVKGLELYRGKLILYGCGDFLNDYEGIAGHEQYRGDLGLMYFVSLQPGTGQLHKLEMTPTRIKNFQLKRAGQEECQWLCALLNRESQIPSASIIMGPAGILSLKSC